jgi:hypothetical protein|tara:strand:- start:4386 stop:4598 length:213 start_codon:yes stop_codon:yes gene_type:complete
MARLINLKCGKCSAKGTLRTGKTIVDANDLLNKKVLGLVKNDPYCFQCGTTFPEGFWKESDGYIYRIQSK